MKIFADVKDKTLSFDLIENGAKPVLEDKSTNYEYDLRPIGNDRYFFRLNGKSSLVQIYRNNEKYNVIIEGEVFEIRVEDERMRTLRELVQKASQTSGEQIITAPIPGLITGIKIKEGDQISPGDSLFVLEAMKMENEIKSPYVGSIKKIMINKGAAVEKDQKLLIIES